MEKKKGDSQRIPKGNWDELREAIASSKPEEPDLKNSAMADEAKRVLSIIKASGVRGQNGLYVTRLSENLQGEQTYANSLIAILAAVTSDKEEAERIRKLVKERIGKGPNLLYAGMVPQAHKQPAPKKPNQTGALAPRQVYGVWGNAVPSQTPVPRAATSELAGENALMGMLEFAMGDKEEAGALFELTKAKTPKGASGMYTKGIGDGEERVDTTAAMGILASLLGKDQEAGELYRLLDEIAPREKGMLGASPMEMSGNTDATALVGILAFLTGHKEDAMELYTAIQDSIPKSKNGIYRKSAMGSGERIDSSAAVGILAATIGDASWRTR